MTPRVHAEVAAQSFLPTVVGPPLSGWMLEANLSLCEPLERKQVESSEQSRVLSCLSPQSMCSHCCHCCHFLEQRQAIVCVQQGKPLKNRGRGRVVEREFLGRQKAKDARQAFLVLHHAKQFANGHERCFCAKSLLSGKRHRSKGWFWVMLHIKQSWWWCSLIGWLQLQLVQMRLSF